MPARLAIAAVTMLACASLPAVADDHQSCPSVWSAEGHALADGPVVSPDGRWRVEPNETTNALHFVSRDGARQRIEVWTNPFVTEVAWSPDSRRVAITSSDGGWVGSWQSTIYVVDAKGSMHAEPIQLTPATQAAFAVCDEVTEYTNLAFAAWLDGGRLALFVEEVPPHSSCTNMGALRGHVYDVARREVVAVLDEGRLRREHAGQLGCRIRIPARDRREPAQASEP